jgi:4a-hydroxytetrahydrobiopterin dehydratase
VSGSIAPARFHELGWRVLAYAACTHFRTASLAEGATLAEAIGTVTEGSSLRPDVDLRSNGVTVRLKVSETGELSEGDVALAREISAGARQLGRSSTTRTRRNGGPSPIPRATRWTLPPGRMRGRNPLATLG